jgi:uncharacterized protein DUF2252
MESRPLRHILLITLVLSGCISSRPQGPLALFPLDIREDAPEIAQHGSLQARLRATPHAYFRFINGAFTREVCRRFADIESFQPAVTLHGDAHVEQYAVTELGRGLSDFDDSATGPAYVDLVRFGVSIRLAAWQRGWRHDAEDVFQAFRRGYRRAIQDPRTEAPVPAFARRAAEGFVHDRLVCLARAEALMESLEGVSLDADATVKELTLNMLATNAGLPPHFFRAKKIGLLRAGIGSALSAKYLVRVEGMTDAPDDDVILEVKELVDRQSYACVLLTPGPSRIFDGQARIGYEPFRYPGVVHIANRTFWVHAWPDNYAEVDIMTLRSAGELIEIAFEAGVQLGRGHPRLATPDEGTRLRVELLRSLPESRIRREIDALTRETLFAWQRFRRTEAAAPTRATPDSP